MDWSKGKVLNKIGLNPSDYVDLQLSALFKKPVFDIYRFEDWLFSEYPDDRELSIKECVYKRFPNIAKELEELFTI